MGNAPAKNCQRTPGCSGRVRDGTCSRCGTSPRSKRRRSSTKRGYGYGWQKRRYIYLRENPLCVDPFGNHGGRAVAAAEVDHIIPLASGGRDGDDNLQPLCKSCHSQKTEGEMRGGLVRYPKAECRAVIVWGPPAGGKTHHVREHAVWGDVIVDVDALYAAISGRVWYDKPAQLLPVVLAARDAIIHRLSRQSGIGTAWILTADIDRGRVEQMAQDIGASIKIIAPPRNQTIKQLMADERRSAHADHWIKLINKWYAAARPEG